jgi:ribonuclease R
LRAGDRPKSFKEVKAHFGLKGNQARELKALLRRLAKGELIKRPRGRKISAAPAKGLILGTLSMNPRGFGFVSPERGKKDIFLPAEELKEAMHGDKLLVRLRCRSSIGPRQGALASIVSRGVSELVGRITKSQGRLYLVPEDRRVTQRILLADKGRGELGEGQVVVARINSYPTRYRPAQAEVIEVLGDAGDEKLDAHIIMHKHGIFHEFSAEVMAAAARVHKQVTTEDTTGRLDLRGFPFVTIDPEDARDFDDAIAVEPQAGGAIRLMVSISDVGHYVPPGGPLDEEAYLRGTSVYFPEFAVHMLPAELSSDICSLQPGQDRLAITAIIDCDARGNLTDCSFHESVIRSQARLTYSWVKAVLEQEDPELGVRFGHFLPAFQIMKELALKLGQRREKQGSLDFDLPDPEIIRDPDGQALGIGRLQRNIAHRIVEEFMIAANESVAKFLAGKHAPVLYRVHEPPDEDQQARLKAFLQSLGISWRVKKEISSKDYQQVIKKIEGTNLEQTVGRFLLRSLKQARYAGPNLGHFGLALGHYTHFTSPIRRYRGAGDVGLDEGQIYAG